ncbi:MAG: sugar ABC transporter permease [Anaerolineae bacterium]|jgi:glucose/mannose transport system permease protein|nr:sugar ABC transporter permease [Anaerolineae bacterium]MDH7474823.1 sugar ABC transporter permease [Anaerolineae bacterium]
MRRLNWERVVSILLLAPAVIAVAIFVYGFIGWTAYASLTKWDQMLPDFTLAGLSNYQKLFANQRFQIDLRNTVVFTIVFLVSCLIIGLTLAILLDQRIRGEGFFRSVYLFPMSISFIVTGVVWRWLLNPGSPELGSTGINLLFDMLGLGFLKTGWYTDPKIGIIAVAIAATWQMSGYTMAMYLAGLRAIPDELREAARVDGASEWQIVRYILLPILQPVTLSAVIVLGHISLKIYDLVVAMTGPGIGFATDVPAYFMWDTTFRGNHFARGAAIATVLLIMVAILIVPYLVHSIRTEAEL